MSTGPRSDSPAAESARWREHGRTALGLAIITACFLAGDWLKLRLGLILPGSVLGLFVLLTLLLSGLVRVAWVDSASRLLIFILPVCFISLYVLAGANRALWREWGVLIAGTLIVTMVLLWIFAGTLAQWLLRRGQPEGAA